MPPPADARFWAKLGTETWPDRYHPVVCHLIDVGQVAAALWAVSLRDPLRSRVSAQLGLSDRRDVGAWVAFWVAAHDIGKVTPCFQFQGKTDALKQSLGRAFATAAGGTCHHTKTGTRILADELTRDGEGRPGLPEGLARKVAVAVGGHHGTFPADWDGITAPLGGGAWATARRELLDHLAGLFGLGGRAAPNPPPGGDQSVWMYLAGLTSVADWVGSNVEFFPPFVAPDRPLAVAFDAEAYFRDSGASAVRALKVLGWLDRAPPTGIPASFAEATGIAEPRPLQAAVIPLAAGMATTGEPRLVVVEAPMGEGKTEAAWYLADCWDRCGGQGTYVALPTMATSNQMFGRVERFLAAVGGKQNLMLLHGKAALNERFEELKYAARVYDDETHPAAVVAEEWFAKDKKQALQAPFGVGTIDQALLGVLQTKHVFVRLFGLAGKCVVLDEVHAYDAYMTTLMERLLRWLAALGCPVVLLSATLPADKRSKLLRAYAGDGTPEPGHAPYPRVTSVAVRGEPIVTPFDADPTRRKEIRLEWVEDGDLVGNLSRDLAVGGCAAVIRNTVGLAQETYGRLKDALAGTGVAVELFHARFPFGRRKRIEDDVLAKYGKGPDGKADNPLRPKKAILVATQVVEQSLDLDFDIMYSDVAPVDLVLQRAGRLHRHDRGDRGQPHLHLIAPGEKGGLPDFGASEWVYVRYLLFKSYLALRTHRPTTHVLELPTDIDDLIGTVYTGDQPPTALTPPEQGYWEEAKQEYERDRRAEEDEAGLRQVKKPSFSGALARIVGEPREEDNPELHPAHQALTRLTRPTAQLICLFADADGTLRLPHDGSRTDPLGIRPMSGGGVGDVRHLLQGELTVADGRVLRELWTAPRTPEEWKEVGMLRTHHLVTFTDGAARIGAVELRLDLCLGLRVVRADSEGDE